MEKAIIQFSVKNDVGIYQIINSLVNNFEIDDLIVQYKGKNWIFRDRDKIRYFLKESYFDFKEGKEVKIKEI